MALKVITKHERVATPLGADHPDAANLDGADVLRLRALRTLRDVEVDFLVLFEAAVAVGLMAE